VYLAAVGTVHFQHGLPGCAETLHIRLNTSRCLLIGFGADEKSGAMMALPGWITGGSATGLSATDAWRTALSVMVELYS
jgi:hypothetical protein